MSPTEQSQEFLKWLRERTASGVPWQQSYRDLGIPLDIMGTVILCDIPFSMRQDSGAKEYWVPDTDELMTSVKGYVLPISRWNRRPVIHTRSRLGSEEIPAMITHYRKLQEWISASRTCLPCQDGTAPRS